MSQSETEHERKVAEYWKKFSIYDIDFKNKDNDSHRVGYPTPLPYKPTAVLKAPPTNQPTRKFSIYDMRYFSR
jgi:hypothetical protein